jgi:hypothetical protein
MVDKRERLLQIQVFVPPERAATAHSKVFGSLLQKRAPCFFQGQLHARRSSVGLKENIPF